MGQWADYYTSPQSNFVYHLGIIPLDTWLGNKITSPSKRYEYKNACHPNNKL